MKIAPILILSILMSSNLIIGQDITNKLGGDTANETYDVTDSADKILFRVQGDGNVGIGTTIPTAFVHLNKGDSPTIRLSQDGTSWPAYAWEIGANESNFFIRDVDSGKLIFDILPGAPSFSLGINSNGNVGVGTRQASEKFEVEFDEDTEVQIGQGISDEDITFITLRSPNGTKYYITVNDAGTLITSTSKP